ncbi:MAG: sensor histidine kinase [Chloroflexota bacterium]
MTNAASTDSLKLATEVQTDELKQRIDQLWISIWITTLLILTSTFTVRWMTGNPVTLPSVIIQIILNGLAIGNLILLKTQYARVAQGLFVFALHLTVPPVLILFGGTRGYGDIALVMVILVSMLHGGQRWMLFTFGIIGATLGWVFYRDLTGNPIEPLLDYSTRFTSIKFVFTMLIMVLLVAYIRTFYMSLVESYRTYAEEQERLNDELKSNEITLETLNDNLQLSRQNIVTAREEERRRIRRDLHDGLGPTLASQIFRIGVARQMVEEDPQKTVSILMDIESGINTTLSDVRKLVYGLRPPLLDQLGLSGSIRDVVALHAEQVEVELDLPAQLPQLSAAVEVAIFFIFQAAFDNVLKHSRAERCLIRLCVEEEKICLVVLDDGIGLKEDQVYGVGLTAMKERAEELGGSFYTSAASPSGTEIRVSIPLLDAALLHAKEVKAAD